MSKKTLWILVVVLAALAVAVWRTQQKESAPAAKGVAAGGMLLASVDLSTVRAITLADSAATTHLARADGVWSVAEQDHYPADLNRLRGLMRALDDVRDTQVADTGAARLAEYGLAAGEESAPLRIELEHGQGTTVVTLGKMREPRRSDDYWMPAAGRYVRVDEGPVLLIKEDIAMAAADPAQWWDRLLLEVAPESIRQVEVASAAGSFVVARDTNGTFSLEGAAAGETVDVAAANRLFGALRALRAEKILPAEAVSNAGSFKAQADGVVYSLQLGEALADSGAGRPVKIDATAAADATPEQQAAAAAVGKKLNGRVHLIPAYLAEALSLKRDALVAKAEAAPAASAPADIAPAEPAPENAEPSESAPEAVAPPVPADS